MFEDHKTRNIDLNNIAFDCIPHRDKVYETEQEIDKSMFLLCRPYLSGAMDEWSFLFQEKPVCGTTKIRCRDWNHLNVIYN